MGVDIFGLITFLLKNSYVTKIEHFKEPINLLIYEDEHEIVMKMSLKNVQDV